MTDEEFFKKNFPQYVTEKGKCLSPFWDLFSAGYETGKDEAETDLATIAYMQGAERYKKELAKRAEQIEALNKDKDYFSDALDKQIEATYKVVEENNELKKESDFFHREKGEYKSAFLQEVRKTIKLNKQLAKAKELLKRLIDTLEAVDGVQVREMKEVKEVEQFLKED